MTHSRRLDWADLKGTIDLVEVATNLLGPPPGRRGEHGSRLWWHCPFHDDQNPSFCIRPGEPTFHCFGCGAHGDAATLVMRANGWSFPEARDFLTGGSLPAGKAPTRPARRPAPQSPAEPSGLPEADALEIVEAAAARLWTDEGAEALEYLRCRRGLSDATIRSARLGMVPPLDLPGRPRGVVIPWCFRGELAHATIRQPGRTEPPYREIFRNPARMQFYPGPEAIHPGRPLVVVEGQFDCLLLGQELAGMASVITLGSASSRLTPEVIGWLLAAPTWYAAHDADASGDEAAARWPSRARRVRPPTFRNHPDDPGPPDTDWTDLVGHGVNLRRWWADRLEGNEAPPLFSWGELTSQRWGPAADDPAPGLTVDQPDRGRMLQALRSADPHDPYAVAEREAVRSEGD